MQHFLQVTRQLQLITHQACFEKNQWDDHLLVKRLWCRAGQEWNQRVNGFLNRVKDAIHMMRTTTWMRLQLIMPCKWRKLSREPAQARWVTFSPLFLIWASKIEDRDEGDSEDMLGLKEGEEEKPTLAKINLQCHWWSGKRIWCVTAETVTRTLWSSCRYQQRKTKVPKFQKILTNPKAHAI